jgi:hypothetical protein
MIEINNKDAVYYAYAERLMEGPQGYGIRNMDFQSCVYLQPVEAKEILSNLKVKNAKYLDAFHEPVMIAREGGDVIYSSQFVEGTGAEVSIEGGLYRYFWSES